MFTADRGALGLGGAQDGGMAKAISGETCGTWVPVSLSLSRWREDVGLVSTDDRLDAAAHHVRMVLGAPTLADVVRSALASALFGWLP
mgnify:FL=1